MFQKSVRLIFQHKIITTLIIAALAGGGYLIYAKYSAEPESVSYVLTKAEKGILITSVSGSGQVSALNQIDVKAQASGEIIYLGVKNGQEVKNRALIARIDSIEAQKSVRDAEANLQSAKISLEKLKKTADQLSILQAENAIASAQESKQKAENDLEKAYEDGFNNVADAFLNLPGIMAGLDDVLFSNDISSSQQNIDYYADAVKRYDEKALTYRNDAYNKYQTARDLYDENFEDYKLTNRFSAKETIVSLVGETYDTTKNIAEAIKSANNLVQFYQDELTKRNYKPNATSNTHLSTLSDYTDKTNSYLSSLLATQNTIRTDKETIVSAERSIVEKTESLANLKAGTDILDIQSQELAIKQKENALADAKANLSNYSIYTPFDGVLAEVSVKRGESVSSGTAVATLITKQRIAEITLNEVDVAKVKIGQKATLSFDAVEGLNITGEVAEVDIVGTASQGVVSYNVKIVFDTQDERIKPGMSVSANIITEVKQDVVLLPNSAVKTSNGITYVEIFDSVSADSDSMAIVSTTAPRQQQVQIGLSNDSLTEIISGLQEGDKVVSKTTTSQTQSQQTQTQSLFSLPGTGPSGGRSTTSGSSQSK